jgi:hypothetical protein
VSPVASALDTAHEAGLVHRDVKPANMLVDVGPGRPEHVYLTDFGLARGLSSAGLTSGGLTTPGQFMGTPEYAAPEQITGGEVDGRADQYALACVAYTLLTGSAPYPREQALAVMYAQLYDPPPLVTAIRRDLPLAVNDALARAMEKQPSDRYESCVAFADALREALDLPPWGTDSTRPYTLEARPSQGGPPVPAYLQAWQPGIEPVKALPGPRSYASRPGTWTAVVASDRAHYDSVWAADVRPEEVIAFPEGTPERRFPLSGAELLIGRRSAAWGIYPEIDVTSPPGGPPTDTGVSREHAKLVAGPDGSWSVVDLGTESGTLVNGREIPPGTLIRLRNGDRVNLGMWTVITITLDEVRAPDIVARDPAGGGNSGTAVPSLGYGGSPGRRYLLARCPDAVPVGKPFSLLASISQAGVGTAAQLLPFTVPPEGLDVLLVLYAPGLEFLGDQRLTVHVPPAGDSDPVMFELRADGEGPRSISITAWLGGSYLGELLVPVDAGRGQAGGAHREFRAEIDAEPSEGAVSLVVRYDPGLNAYRFEFRDEDNPCEVVSRLSFEPRERIERLMAGLDRLAAGRSGYSPDQARDYLVNAGAELWRELVPPGLREQFWDRQHRIRQLTILADKDTVPWELLYPREPGRDAGFLVQQFPVTRAIFGRRPASRLSLWPARFVLPCGSLPEAEAEIHAMRRLLDPSQVPEVVVSDLAQLRDLIHAGDFGLLHFACHNRFEPDDDASISLGNAQFTPRLMTTAVIDKVLARSAPTVFMNACRSAGLAPTYNRLDGWAGKFLEAGAGAFIGSLWAVSDGTAREFAEELYAQLKAGTSLGRAMMDARAKAATHADDPTWLAYSAYGNPRATVMRRP